MYIPINWSSGQCCFFKRYLLFQRQASCDKSKTVTADKKMATTTERSAPAGCTGTRSTRGDSLSDVRLRRAASPLWAHSAQRNSRSPQHLLARVPRGSPLYEGSHALLPVPRGDHLETRQQVTTTDPGEQNIPSCGLYQLNDCTKTKGSFFSIG